MLYAQRWDERDPDDETTRALEVPRLHWELAVYLDRHSDPYVGPQHWVRTIDHATGEEILIARTCCGAGCRCAAGWRAVE